MPKVLEIFFFKLNLYHSPLLQVGDTRFYVVKTEPNFTSYFPKKRFFQIRVTEFFSWRARESPVWFEVLRYLSHWL